MPRVRCRDHAGPGMAHRAVLLRLREGDRHASATAPDDRGTALQRGYASAPGTTPTHLTGSSATAPLPFGGGVFAFSLLPSFDLFAELDDDQVVTHK